MKTTDKILTALNKAADLHDGQVRKVGGEPYIIHPVAVAWIVAEYTDDEDVVCAALFHDILEDVPNYSFEEMVIGFGRRVAELVKGVSEDKNPKLSDDNQLPWVTRKANYLNNLSTASPDTWLIAAGDKLHNLWSMIQNFKNEGESVWQVFGSDITSIIKFHGDFIDLSASKIDPSLHEKLVVYLNMLKDLTNYREEVLHDNK